MFYLYFKRTSYIVYPHLCKTHNITQKVVQTGVAVYMYYRSMTLGKLSGSGILYTWMVE